MLKPISKQSTYQRTIANRLGLISLMVVMLISFSSFISLGGEGQKNGTPQTKDCTNPLAASLEYNAFVRYETHLKDGDTEGPIAIGGDLSLKGIITVAAQTAGIHKVDGENEAASLVVNGKVHYDAGQGIHLNEGFVKIGDLTGSKVFDIDNNNATVNARITSGVYDAFPRIQVQRKQSASSMSNNEVIDFESAFLGFESKATNWSTLSSNLTIDNEYKISLTSNQLNVINITDAELLAMPYLTFENQPDIDTPLIINVSVSSSVFEWNVFNINSIGDQHGRYIIWNFYNAEEIILNGGGTLVGSLFAPKASVVKNSSGNINGQVIAAKYYHNGGELHQHPFTPCIEEDTPADDTPMDDTPICSISVDLGEDQSICIGDSVTLTASEGDSFLWSNGETTQSIVISPLETTEYEVNVTKDTCNASDKVLVTVIEIIAEAGDDVTIEPGDTVELIASGGDSYLWSTGENTQAITVSPESTTEYTVTVFQNNCEDTDVVTVTVETGCSLTVNAGDDKEICQGDSIRLFVSVFFADSFEWRDDSGEIIATSKSVVVTPSKDEQEYTVTVTQDGCSKSDSVTIFFDSSCSDMTTSVKSVYPTFLNAKSKINMDISSEQEQSVQIYLHSMKGSGKSPVITKKLRAGSETLSVDLSELPLMSSGLYVLEIFGNGWSKKEKIIVGDKSFN